MIRTKKGEMKSTETGDGKIWWRRIGGKKAHHINGHIIKPGEKFRARPEDVPEAFRDVIVPLESLPTEKEEQEIVNTLNPIFSLEKRGRYWDVVDANGKIMNEETTLNKTAAEELKTQLEA